MSEPTPRAPIATSPLSVILTAQALSTQTAEALDVWRRYLDAKGRPYEILLIQETRPEVPPTPEEPPPAIRVFPYDRFAGFRDAMNAAIAAAQHPLLVFCPCDKQYQPADLDGLMRVIDEVDLVVGYRTGQKAPEWRLLLDTISMVFCRVVLGVPTEPRVCWLGSRGWGRRWVARWIFGLRVHDPECAFRVARREIFKHLPIQSRGPFVQVEMLAKANHLSCVLAQEPVTWTPPRECEGDAITFGEDAWGIFRNPDFGNWQAETAKPDSVAIPTDAPTS
jgi:hypothetical protein